MAPSRRPVPIPYLREPAVHVTYDNGYQFVYVPKRGEVFNVSTWVRTGSVNEDEHNNGVSHFLEHLMFKGTKRFAPGEFDKAMESMGAVINAATWKDFTFYYVNGPQGTENRNFVKALDMHADMLLFSTLPDAEIGEQFDAADSETKADKRERGVVIEEIGMRGDQPWTKVYNAVNHLMYPEGHPYRRDVIGTPKIIGDLPRADILDYYRRWYGPNTMTTIVVGDFDEAWLEDQVLKSFDFNKRPAVQPGESNPFWTFNAKDQKTRSVRLDGQTQTSFFIMGFHGPRATELKASIAVDVASRVLGEGRSSRLYQQFLERPASPVFNTISCGQSTFTLGNVFFIQGNFNSPDADACLKEVHAEVEKLLQDQPITREEFERAVKKMKVEFAETSETASGIAESVGESLTVSGTLDDFSKYLDILQSLTLEDVQAAAEKWFQPSSGYTACLVPRVGATTDASQEVAA